MKTKTQTELIIKHLKSHKRGITSWKAITKYHVTRLSAVIYILRGEGICVADEWIQNGKSSYKRYFIDE